MALRNPKFVERSNDVKFCVDLGAAECVERLSNQRKRVTVLDRHVVQAAIVLTDPHSPSRLRGEEEGRSAPGARRTNKALIEVIIKPLSDHT